MKSPKCPCGNSIIGGLALALALATSTPSAHANVYATNIKLNGSLLDVSVAAGASVSISYVLNDTASSGVTVKILSGATVVRTITGAGSSRGLNTVSWDGKDDSNANLPAGNYSVSVTAGATGYSDWTQISNDGDPGNYVYEPKGIAVNQNPGSAYYGRVFVGNSAPGTGDALGDQVGILKLNADASFADEGGFSTGGYMWAGDYFSPWKMEVSGDDKLYVNDWTGNGNILAFDQVLSDGHLSVLRDDNNPGVANMSGPFITGAGLDTQIWMADANYASPPGLGILRWSVTADGTCAADDKGTQIIPRTFGSDLNIYPYDVAVDKNGKIYTIQYRVNDDDPANRVLRFPAYEGTTLWTAEYKVGAGDNSMKGAFGIAVDPTATYVAVAFRTSGGIAIMNAADLSTIKRDLAPMEDHRDVAWDNVGNVYACDNWASLWRAYSPPGANEATTVAVPTVEVTGGAAVHPTLTVTQVDATHLQFTWTGSYKLVKSSTATGASDRWITVAGASPLTVEINLADPAMFFGLAQ
jgi:hypothetical protein